MERFKRFKNVFDKNRKLFYVILVPIVASIVPIVIQNKVISKNTRVDFMVLSF
jgi:hypothetical protein